MLLLMRGPWCACNLQSVLASLPVRQAGCKPGDQGADAARSSLPLCGRLLNK